MSVKKKKSSQRHGFRTGEHVVYPSHGVGQIVEIDQQSVVGITVEFFVINFEREKMTLRVPTHRVQSAGMRKLAGAEIIDKALETLRGRARVKRAMWSRRAQEYETKINSGDLVAIAEVVRDLHRGEGQPEQSYSERQLCEAALDRMVREISAVRACDDEEAVDVIRGVLSAAIRERGKLLQDKSGGGRERAA